MPSHSEAQTIVYNRMDSVEVQQILGIPLKNPWAGGFNSMQFSEIDLDLDGRMDLVAFDRTGNRLTTYLNNGTPGVVDYKHAPQYQSSFPDNLHDWVLFRDYNCDGLVDIFAYSSGGFAVYKNTSSSSLSFQLVSNLIYSDYYPDTTSVNMVNLYVSQTDLPAIDDIDNDGDIDVLTFDVFGTGVEYHKNFSMERYGHCDSLAFKIKNCCWGYFSEALTNNSVNLYDTCSCQVVDPEKQAPKQGQQGGLKHTGSSLFTLDINNDTVMELVLGDVTFNNLVALYNGGTRSSAVMVNQDTLFPSLSSPTSAVDIPIFPSGFYLDVNSDSVKDLLASPNTPNSSQNYKGCWYYPNSGTDHLPVFNFQSDAFLQNGMIEVGEGCHPVLFDYNVDGKLDLVIGNYGYYSGPASYISKLALYENIGTLTQPKFKLVNSDYGGLSSINLNTQLNQPALGLYPTFGDLDGDGDEDMIVGDYEGKVHYFVNNPSSGKAVFTLSQVNYFGIDVGQFATPQLFDLDGDNILDLIIGERNGNLNFYQNTGTNTSPSFTQITTSLGGVDTRLYQDFVGFSQPFFYRNGAQIEAVCGSTSGYIFKYDNISSNILGTYNLVDSMYQNIWDGMRSTIIGGDINNDAIMDFTLGNYSGGCTLLGGNQVTLANEDQLLDTELSIFPNPADNIVRVMSPIPVEVHVLDLSGRMANISGRGTNFDLHLNELKAGVYVLRFSDAAGHQTVRKLVKK